jgi:hypothetical protein
LPPEVSRYRPGASRRALKGAPGRASTGPKGDRPENHPDSPTPPSSPIDIPLVLPLNTSYPQENRYRDASVAAQRAKSGSVLKQIETAAAPQAKALQAKMAKAKDDSWVRDFWAFREQFQFAEAARTLLDAYARLRQDHDKPAADLFWKARGDFQNNDREAAYKRYEEIVGKYYGSKWYYYAKRGLEARGNR